MIRLSNFDAVLILAGAGFSADSNLPVFRDDGGFWNEYPPLKAIGASFEMVASPMFQDTHEELFAGFYAHRLTMYREIEPHDGYRLLLDKINQAGVDYQVVTTNVDGHFIKAGYEESKVCEMHGSIHYYQCSDKACAIKRPLLKAPASLKATTSLSPSFLPKCESCNEPLRPNIVMFNDWEYKSDRIDEAEKGYRRWINKLMEQDKKLLILEFGAGQSVASLRVMHNQLLMNVPEWLGVRINTNPDHAEASKYNMLSDTSKTLDFITKIM
ncbi:SIR2 family NAD-dependent protein deacylase [Vibrio owensii]|uniref:SIR2 family NAD-dependent protein deacylase n=1 Tax=Vibrio harveyi group TaxID=717610 RepID=UPI003CC5E3AF